MNPPQTWSPPTLPPTAHLSDEGETVFFAETEKGPRRDPAPRLDVEVRSWSRPSGAASFPVHPVGVAELFHRAADLLGHTPAVEGRAEDEQRALAAYLWLATQALYRPGASIRAAIDDFLSGRKYLPPNLSELRGSTRQAATRMSLLAGWAVIRASCEWAREAE